MLPAKKNEAFMRLFEWYTRRLMRGAFDAVRVRGGANLRGDGPLLLYGNHPGWWDPLFAFFITRRYKLDGYLMGEEKQVRAYPFFRLIGGFSVNRADPRDAARSVRYAGDLLKDGAAVWIFPQGEIVAPDVRPVTFLPGTAHILRRVPECRAVPFAWRYDFVGQARPEAFMAYGAAEVIRGGEINVEELTAKLQKRLTGECDGLREAVLTRRFDDFEVILKGKRSVNVVWDEWKRRLFGVQTENAGD
jgi:hypothetical protein